MTRYASLLAAALLVGGTATLAGAQQGPPGGAPRMGQQGPQGQQGQRMMTMLLRDITLSADQQARLEQVNEEFEPRQAEMRRQMMAARQSGQRTSPEAMQKMRDLQTEHRAAVRAILTVEQQAVFDRNVEAMPQGRGQRGGGRPPRA